MARIVCSSTVYVWYMSCCVCATTRPKSGTKRPNTPASLRRRKVVSGSWREVSIAMNRRLASGSLRRLIDQPDVLGDQPQRRRMDVEVVLLRDMEQAQDRHRILANCIGRRGAQPLAVEAEAVELARPQGLPQRRELGLAAVAVLERGDEDAREIADRLGDEDSSAS